MPESTTSIETPKPGSPDAVEAGCCCPTIENRYGRGAYVDNVKHEPVYIVDALCPIHGLPSASE